MFVEFWFLTPRTHYISPDVLLTCEANILCCFKILLSRIARQEHRRAISGLTLLYLALGLTETSDESLRLDVTNIERRLITETSKFYTKHSHTLIQIWWQRVTFRLYPKRLTLSASVPLDTVHTTVRHIYFYIFHGATAFNGPGAPQCRGSTIILRHTTRQNSSGRVIGPSQRPLPDKTQYLRYLRTGIHAPGGIRTRSPSKRAAAAADRRLTPRGNWDRLQKFTVIIVSYGSTLIPVVTCFNKRTLTLSVLLRTKILFCSKVPITDTLNLWQEEHGTILHPSRLDKEGFIIWISAALSMYSKQIRQQGTMSKTR